MLWACLPLAHAFADEGDRRDLRIGAYVDMGQVVKGSAPTLGRDHVDGLFLPRMGVSLTAEESVGENLHLVTGVGGLFWYAVDAQAGADHTRIIRFGPGITEASFRYDFTSALSTRAGFITYKYNPQAQDLGEYLFRSECYPSLVYTEGWSWLDNAAAQTLGWQLRWTTLGGAWINDFLILSDMSEQPKWDFSPSAVSTLKIGKILEIGAGISLHRWLPIQPSAERPDDSLNTYAEFDHFPAVPFLADTVWKDPAGDHVPANFDHLEWRQLAFAGGTLKGNLYDIAHYRPCADAATCHPYLDSTDASGNRVFAPRVLKRYTFQGIKLMGRFTLDLKPLLGMEGRMGPEELKVFGEAAVLGLQDQVYYYDDVTQRIPLMFGINLPSFRFLDRASLQFEYFRNPWPDSKQQNWRNGLPVWDVPLSVYAHYVQLRGQGLYAEDDWKWSLNLLKTLAPGLQLQLQAANDHFRLRTWDDDLTYVPLTNKRSHWYYLARLQWGV